MIGNKHSVQEVLTEREKQTQNIKRKIKETESKAVGLLIEKDNLEVTFDKSKKSQLLYNTLIFSISSYNKYLLN